VSYEVPGPPRLDIQLSSIERSTTPARNLPVQSFLERCYRDYAGNFDGAVADYIPELSKADPAKFGVSLTTMDGEVYGIGDDTDEFTIQSISKAFVFALALELLGPDKIQAKVGVEPSGEAFNSIRLTEDNRPFNPMVNAGAIACSGLIYDMAGQQAFALIQEQLGRFAGRPLELDDSVYESERATGNRNRAIAWMLHNYGIVSSDVDAVLDVYFRQCSLLVTARDIGTMAATLANRGINPVTRDRVISDHTVARALSVMTSSGMYDYAGEWTYRVGIPAKSGVGGGIIAALPGQFGLGTFSPLLDSHGNSVRGVRVCEALSSGFELHFLKRHVGVQSSIIADYDLKGISSTRTRRHHEKEILDLHYDTVRVIELVGALDFATSDYVSRRLTRLEDKTRLILIDLRRTPNMSRAAMRIFRDLFAHLDARGVTVVLTGFDTALSASPSARESLLEAPNVRCFSLLDEGIEWCEDQIVYRHGGFTYLAKPLELREQPLLEGISDEVIHELEAGGTRRAIGAGQKIIAFGEPATSLFFLLGGLVSVKLPSGVRLASLSSGMAFGEMALLENARTADVWSDTAISCLEVSLTAYSQFRAKHPHAAERIMRNLAALMVARLKVANAKVDQLSTY
jgi:glutaminase